MHKRNSTKEIFWAWGVFYRDGALTHVVAVDTRNVTEDRTRFATRFAVYTQTVQAVIAALHQ